MSVEKLVRDRIPELLAAANRNLPVRQSAAAHRLRWLLEKLHEEAAEVSDNPCVEEIADVLEVLHALAYELGCSWTEVEDERVRKRDKRGAFADGWLLTLPGPGPRTPGE